MIEGMDGSGKSTLVKNLTAWLKKDGFRVTDSAEPSDSPLGRLAREYAGKDPRAAAMLFTLDRQNQRGHVEAALQKYDIVVQDRSFYSTLAYQGSAFSEDAFMHLAAIQVVAAVRPDLVILLDGPVRTAMSRLNRRKTAREPVERTRFQERVRAGYLKLAEREGFTKIPFTLPEKEILQRSLNAVQRALKARRTSKR